MKKLIILTIGIYLIYSVYNMLGSSREVTEVIDDESIENIENVPILKEEPVNTNVAPTSTSQPKVAEGPMVESIQEDVETVPVEVTTDSMSGMDAPADINQLRYDSPINIEDSEPKVIVEEPQQESPGFNEINEINENQYNQDNNRDDIEPMIDEDYNGYDNQE